VFDKFRGGGEDRPRSLAPLGGAEKKKAANMMAAERKTERAIAGVIVRGDCRQGQKQLSKRGRGCLLLIRGERGFESEEC